MEELRRIGRESQQMTLAALRPEAQLQDLLTLCNSGTYSKIQHLTTITMDVC